MAATVVASGTSSPCIHLYGSSSKKTYITTSVKRGGSRKRGSRNLGHLTEVVRKDMEILKNGIGRGLEWANEAFRIPKILKTVDDFILLRNLEDPCATLLPPLWPPPSYPGLSGVDLLMADLKLGRHMLTIFIIWLSFGASPFLKSMIRKMCMIISAVGLIQRPFGS